MGWNIGGVLSDASGGETDTQQDSLQESGKVSVLILLPYIIMFMLSCSWGAKCVQGKSCPSRTQLF